MIINIDKNNIEQYKYSFDILRIREDLDSNPFTKCMAYMDTKIVAYLLYADIYDRFEVLNIFVDENCRNNKIASKLLEKMINRGKEKKIKNITLEVKQTNEIAIHLYKKYGFKEVAIRSKYYYGIDGILMEKEMM